MRARSWSLIGAVCLMSTLVIDVPPMVAQVTFSEIPLEEVHPDGLYCNMSVSSDGTVAGFWWAYHIYRWTGDSGVTLLADNTIVYPMGASIGVSGDGLTLLSSIKNPHGLYNPAIWRPPTGWTHLGGIAGQPPLGNEYGAGSALDHDGTAGTGLGWSRNTEGYLRATAFLWTEEEWMTGLPKTNDDFQSRGNDISGDGRIVIGFHENDFGSWRPCRWVDGGEPEFFLGEETLGTTMAISHDATYTVLSVNGVSYRYSEIDGLIPLGILGWPTSRGNDVADDGTVVGWDGYTALIWTEESGLRTVADVLTDAGVTEHLNWDLFWAISISADGTTIVGAGRKPNGWAGAWRAVFPPVTTVSHTVVHAIDTLDSRPNPFNPSTRISFDLARAQRAALRIYDVRGRYVATLCGGLQPAGHTVAMWQGTTDDGRPVSSGTYLVRLDTESGTDTHTIQLVR